MLNLSTDNTGSFHVVNGNIGFQLLDMIAAISIVVLIVVLIGLVVSGTKPKAWYYPALIAAIAILGASLSASIVTELNMIGTDRAEFIDWADDRYGIDLTEQAANTLRDIDQKDAGSPGGTIVIDSKSVTLLPTGNGGYLLMGNNGTVELPVR